MSDQDNARTYDEFRQATLQELKAAYTGDDPSLLANTFATLVTDVHRIADALELIATDMATTRRSKFTQVNMP